MSEEEKVVQPYAAVLQELSGGASHEQASAALHEAVAAVNELGGTATVTVTITIKPVAKDDTSTLLVVADVKKKVPTKRPKVTTYYVGKAGDLTRHNPNQPDITGLRIAEPVNVKVAGE